ncbi:MAG: RDD family protein [Nitrospinota bacterium]|nr:MAG: RDD family protein [Nitrospinota bacterium]
MTVRLQECKDALPNIWWTSGQKGTISGVGRLGDGQGFFKLWTHLPPGWGLVEQLHKDFDHTAIWAAHIPQPLLCTALDPPFVFQHTAYRYLLVYEYLPLEDFDTRSVLSCQESWSLLAALYAVFLQCYTLGYVYHDISWLHIKRHRVTRVPVVVDLESCVPARTAYHTLQGTKAYHLLFLSLACAKQKGNFSLLPFVTLCQLWLAMQLGRLYADPTLFWGSARLNRLIRKVVQKGEPIERALRAVRLSPDGFLVPAHSMSHEIQRVLEVATQILDRQQPAAFNTLLQAWHAANPMYTRAGLGRRIVAAAIDTMVQWGLFIFLSPFLGPLQNWLEPYHFVYYSTEVDIVLAVVWLWFLIGGLYTTLLEGSPRQGTLGKVFMRLLVTDRQGKRISRGWALIRTMNRLLPFLPLIKLPIILDWEVPWPVKVLTVLLPPVLAYGMAAITRRHQALHDLLSGTVVVKPLPGTGGT